MFPQLEQTKKDLTFKPKKRGPEKPEPIVLYRDAPERGWIAVPPAWGMRHLGPYLDVVDQTTQGEPFLSPCNPPDPNHPAVRDPVAQAKFIADMTAHVTQNPWPMSFRGKADTGTGKTVVGSWIAGGIVRRKTLILSHKTRINDQWVGAFHNIMGVPLERIGMVQEGRKDWRDKDVVISTLQSIALTPGSMPAEFYQSFGCVVPDEVHRCGAPQFSQALWQFPAAVKFGLSATHKRKDGAEVVIDAFLDEIAVESRAAATPIQIYPIWYRTSQKLWGDTHGARVMCLTRDVARNRRIVGLIKRMYDAGRNILVVGEVVQHLQDLMSMCARAGIPRTYMGQYTATLKEVVEKPVPNSNRMQRTRRTKPQKKAELERVKIESRVIFSTYGMIEEGVDIPRLDGGIDVTPRARGTQIIGRVRREHEGKRWPAIWLTMVDQESPVFMRYYESRLAEYIESGAEVISR